MAKNETQPPDSLDLSWPHHVNYQVDINRPHPSTFNGDREAEAAGADQRPVTTYNGVPRGLLRYAQPLSGDEIRVLDLNRGTRGMPLVGSLRKVRLSNTDGYEPLSYTWEDYDTVQPPDGNTKDYFHTTLCLMDTGVCLNLTSNCAKALRSVRRSTTDRTIWVDAICVNQDDPEERSRQVDMMKDIYATAFTVLVYLGGESKDDDGSSNIAMSLLAQPDRLQQSYLLEGFETRSLKRLFERPYFQRMWIVQEVALAQTIEFHCGPATAYVSKFAGKPLAAILGSRVTPPWLRHSTQTDRDIPGSHTEAAHLLTLILDTAFCSCKDDRDRIFALLSLVGPSRMERLNHRIQFGHRELLSHQQRLNADYNLSTAQVYTGTAAYLATNGFFLGVLILARHWTVNSCPGLPSWVPDWKSLEGSGLRSPTRLNRNMSTSRSVTSSIIPTVISSGAIVVRGMLLGSVTSSGTSRNDLLHGAYMDRYHLLSAEIFASAADPYSSSERHENPIRWSLVRPTENPLDLWEWHLEFFFNSRQSRNGQHLALMFPDYSTILILSPHDSLPGQYTLVDIGKPLIRVVWPEVWAVHRCTERHIGLDFLKSTTDFKQPERDIFLSSTDVFPRLSDYDQLWGLNPFTMTMTLTHAAIQQILRTDMSELYLLQRWQEHGRVCVEILRDGTRLRQLIDQVNSLQRKDYTQKEEAAGLTQKWSLVHFLSLLIKDPFDRVTMEQLHLPLHCDQPLDGIDALEQLMQWAQVTYRLLMLLSKEERMNASVWPDLPRDWELCTEAMYVAEFRTENIIRGRGPDRAALLLGRILGQFSDNSNREPEPRQHGDGKRFYWDWKRFYTVMDQRFSILSRIQPDVEKIQAGLRGCTTNFGLIPVHQVLAAHGFDPSKKEFTEVQIR